MNALSTSPVCSVAKGIQDIRLWGPYPNFICFILVIWHISRSQILMKANLLLVLSTFFGGLGTEELAAECMTVYIKCRLPKNITYFAQAPVSPSSSSSPTVEMIPKLSVLTETTLKITPGHSLCYVIHRHEPLKTLSRSTVMWKHNKVAMGLDNH